MDWIPDTCLGNEKTLFLHKVQERFAFFLAVMIQCDPVKGNRQTIHQVIRARTLSVPTLPLAILIDNPQTANALGPLARSLNLPLIDNPRAATLVLRRAADRLELCKPGDPGLPGSLWVDFSATVAGRRRHQPGRDLLVQAVKVRVEVEPLLVDATAGMGRDGFLLAAAGFRVVMFEANPVVAALLADGLERARRLAELASTVDRIRLVVADAVDHLPNLENHPHVIYLDPMFPLRTKSALVKQELRLLQLLDRHSSDPALLLQTALAVQPRKVVVKRPLKGPALSAWPPDYSLKGKAIRFDVYVGRGKKEQSA